MCALLALVVPKELRVSTTRTLRFVEAYISKWRYCDFSLG